MKGIFEEIDEQKEKIWSIWIGKYHNMGGDFDEIWPTYKVLSDQTDIKTDIIKKFVKECRDLGIAYYATTVNGEEGLFAGRGNFVYSKFQKETYREALSIAVNNGK